MRLDFYAAGARADLYLYRVHRVRAHRASFSLLTSDPDGQEQHGGGRAWERGYIQGGVDYSLSLVTGPQHLANYDILTDEEYGTRKKTIIGLLRHAK